MGIPTEVPAEIRAGTAVSYRRTYWEYPADGGWALTLYLCASAPTAGEAGVANFKAEADGAAHLVALDAEGTSDLPAGDYVWAEMVENGGEPRQAACGRLMVLPNIMEAAAGGCRSPAEIELATVRAQIKIREAVDIASLSVADRALVREQMEVWYQREATLARQVASEHRMTTSRPPILAAFVPPGIAR